MATLYPERLPPGAPDSERRVMEALAQGLDDDHVVFHSVAWHAQSRKPDGEADFLIAHPDRGLLVLEVKGGGIDYNASTAGWTSRDRSGVTHEIRNPYTQALSAKHELVREIKADQRWPARRAVQMGYAVVFPDVVVTDSGFGPLGKREVVLGKNDLSVMGEAIESRFRHWAAADPAPAPGHDGLRALVERFGRSWSYRIPLQDAIAEDEQRIVELTAQQMDVLSMLERHSRAAVGGCAGSGKSLLAVAKAEALGRAGKRVLLTCFNKALAKHWSETLDLPASVDIRHFHGFCSDRVRASRVRAPTGLGDDGYIRWLPTGLLEAIATDPISYDAVIVDEGQDFEADWLESLDLLLPADSGIFYVFFDDNQRIYRSDALPAWLGEPYQLVRNVRNSDQVGELVREFYKGEMRLSGVAGRPIQCSYEPEDADGVPGLVTGLRSVLGQLREDGANPSDIVVLTGHKIDFILRHRRMGPWTLRARDEPNGDVLVETIHSFKGQDRPIVILADIGDYLVRAEAGDPAAEAILYVGLSRARSLLVLLAQAPAIPSLQRRLASARER